MMHDNASTTLINLKNRLVSRHFGSAAFAWCRPRGVIGLFVAMLFTTVLQASEPEIVAVYTYHTHPPFITSEDEGLSYDLAEYLTQKSHGQFKFVVMPMSRPRLNKLIETPQTAIVPWVNPIWFKDESESKYKWTENPLMEDANGIVSRRDHRVLYEGPSSLEGLTFGGIRGHVYAGIDDFIDQSPTTRRVDADNHLENFRKLQNARIDVTLTPESAARFLLREHALSDKLHLSPKPHSRYQRRVMIFPHNRRDLKDFLDDILTDVSDSAGWTAILQRYR